MSNYPTGMRMDEGPERDEVDCECVEVSDCCGYALVDGTDVCSGCREYCGKEMPECHCEEMAEERENDRREDALLDRQESRRYD